MGFEPDVWEPRFESFLRKSMASADSAHDMGHIHRVVATARQLASAETARLEIVIPAAWLHDCVVVAKDSPDRSKASQRAARVAVDALREWGFPSDDLPAVAHAIEAHSFSAGLPPETREARVVQDADRLDALGAIGIARCFMVGGSLSLGLYDPEEPFPVDRQPDDRAWVLDHFYVKLFGLPDTMQTAAGRREAQRRAQFMRDYLDQLRAEIGTAELG